MGRQLVKNAEIGSCPAGSQWYTCKLSNFAGCCKSDPCSNPGPKPCSDEDTPSIVPTSASPTTTAQVTTTSDVTSDATTSTEPTDTIVASATTGSTLTTSILSTTDATGGPTIITETVSLPSPTDSSQSNSGSSSASLSKGAIVGASIGGTVGAIALLLIVFLLIRRRRISKRMSSTRGGSPNFFDEKSAVDQTQGKSKGKGTENDVFAPFGGRANSQELDRRQVDSGPAYIELDANDAEKSNGKQQLPSELPHTPKQGSSSPGSSQFHPSPLTPGQPGTQMGIQNQLKPGTSSDDALGDDHRATLNSTKTERANGRHVLSWNSP